MTERFRIRAQVHARRFENEIVVLDLGAGNYFSLDPVGATIWDQIAAGKSADETVRIVLDEFDVDEATARADVQRLIQELVGAGLVERDS